MSKLNELVNTLEAKYESREDRRGFQVFETEQGNITFSMGMICIFRRYDDREDFYYTGKDGEEILEALIKRFS